MLGFQVPNYVTPTVFLAPKPPRFGYSNPVIYIAVLLQAVEGFSDALYSLHIVS